MNISDSNLSFSVECQESACSRQDNLPEKQALAGRLLKVIPLIFIMFTSIICNGLVFRFVFSNRSTLTAINILILSQSLADMGATVFVIPFAVVSVIKDRWVFGYPMCVVNSFFNMYFTVITLLNLALIAYDRYYAVVKARTTQRKSAIWIIICTWSGAFLFTFPWLPFLSDKVTVEYFPGFHICGQRFLKPTGGAESCVFILICLAVILCPLFVIIYSFQQISKYIHGKQHRISPTIPSKALKLSIDTYAKYARTSLLVIVTSILQVFPACIAMAIDGLELVEIPYGLETFLKWIMWCHCIVKPIIYAARRRSSQNLSARSMFLKFLNSHGCFINRRKATNCLRGSCQGVKYNAKTPSIIFCPQTKTKNFLNNNNNKKRKTKYLKKAWSLENDLKFNDINITLKPQT